MRSEEENERRDERRARLIERALGFSQSSSFLIRRGSYQIRQTESSSDDSTTDWLQRSLFINIPSNVINMIAVEAVKQAMSAELRKEMTAISHSNLVHLIAIPIALALSSISLLSAIVFINMGAWITSIPFILSTIFGIYFYYLQERKRNK